MKILLMTTLLVLIGCGKTKTVEKEVIKEIEKEIIKEIDNTKKPVGLKVYGKHALVTYDDGSTQWIHPEGFNAIEDVAAHNAQAAQYVADLNSNAGDALVNYTLVKSETLMGKGWVLVKWFRADDGKSGDMENLEAFNMDNNPVIYSGVPYPEDGGIVLNKIGSTYTSGIVEVEDGVFNFSDLSTANVGGVYNLATLHGEQGTFNISDSGVGISYRPTPGTGTTSSLNAADLGMDNVDLARDFYLSQDIDSKKDLENLASAIETEELTRYGLSTKTAKMVKNLAKTAGNRALTAREKDMFSKELLGLSFNKAAEMMVEDYDGLIEKAAELNETSPEAVKELINNIL